MHLESFDGIYKGDFYRAVFVLLFIYCPRRAGEERFEPEKTII